MKKTLSMLAIMSAVLVSCTKSEINEDNGNNGNPPDEPVYEISITPKDLTFGAEGGDQSVTVTSSEDWYLDGESDWCEVSTSYGSNGDKVTFSADPYENTAEERTATFTFYCGDKDVELVVTQEAKVYSISVEPKELEFESSADEKTVIITSSDDWDFITEDDWISVSEQNGETGASVKVIVTENDKAEIRTGVATFRCGDKQADVKITQEAKEFSISVEPKELMFEAEGGKYEITVASSDEWSISQDDYWLSYTKNEDNENLIIISAGANFTDQSRSCTLTFICGDKTAELIATQKPDDSPIIQFKDVYFLEALLENNKIDRNGDEQISEMEARLVTNLELTHRVQNLIRNIDELSYFTSLETLKIRHACEESLSLIMPNYAKLKEVEIALQKFDNINLSNCKYLEKISGFQATKIINLSGCVALKEVGLTAPDIDVSGCSMLEVLGVNTNFLNVTGCTALKELSISGSLNTVDLSSLIALEKFDYSGYDGLTSLDLSNNTALKELYCSSNQLTSLDLSNNTALTELYCNSNQLTSLDLSNNTALTELSCYFNQLTSLDVSHCTMLTYLNCTSNQLTSLDLSNNTALTELSCGSNQLTSLDLSNNKALEWLGCGGNSLQKLILYKYNILKEIDSIESYYGDIIEYVE